MLPPAPVFASDGASGRVGRGVADVRTDGIARL